MKHSAKILSSVWVQRARSVLYSRGFLALLFWRPFFVTMVPRRLVVVLGLNVGEIGIVGETGILGELGIVGNIGIHGKIGVCIVVVE
ncbi:hypothetical protein Tco_0824914 [Tanacetum coccineum]